MRVNKIFDNNNVLLTPQNGGLNPLTISQKNFSKSFKAKKSDWTTFFSSKYSANLIVQHLLVQNTVETWFQTWCEHISSLVKTCLPTWYKGVFKQSVNIPLIVVQILCKHFSSKHCVSMSSNLTWYRYAFKQCKHTTKQCVKNTLKYDANIPSYMVQRSLQTCCKHIFINFVNIVKTPT